jgi:hypothetical protein
VQKGAPPVRPESRNTSGEKLFTKQHIRLELLHNFFVVVCLQSEEMTTCRIDHYQTLTEVHVSIFAKQADKERSVIIFEETQVVPSSWHRTQPS